MSEADFRIHKSPTAPAEAVTNSAMQLYAVPLSSLAPLDSVASSSQVVRGSDPRLGLRGGVALTVGGTASVNALSPLSPFNPATLGILFGGDSPLSGNPTTRWLFGTANMWSAGAFGAKVVNGVLWLTWGTDANTASETSVSIPAGAKTLWFCYDPGANTVSVYADTAGSPFRVQTLTGLSASLRPIVVIGSVQSNYAYTGTILSIAAFNFLATQADRIAAMRGEYPQAWIGGTPNVAQGSTTWIDVAGAYAASGGVIATNAGGVLAVSGASAIPTNSLWLNTGAPNAPIVRAGQTVRLRYTLTLNSGDAPRVAITSSTSVGSWHTASVSLSAGTNVLDIPAITTTGNGGLAIMLKSPGAHDFSFTAVSVEILGAQLLVGPQDWTRTRGVDMSGNCNDLIYGAGVVAIEPATKARVIKATTAGATVSAGTVATIGTLSGADYLDAKALAALRQWDSVSANWRQARPANCAALQAAVTANGTPLVEATAITGNAVVSTNAALNLTHTIN